MNLDVFTRMVRPARVAALVEPIGPTEDPLLLYGHGDRGVDLFERVAPIVGWGSAVVLTGVPTANAEVVDRAEEVARKNHFRVWYRGVDMPGFPPAARSWVKSMYDGATYSTHLPHLLEAVRRTTGPVLELGAGDTSTPALHEACAKTGRLLVTVDNSVEWLEKFRRLETPRHTLVRLDDPANYVRLSSDYWGVVFVDHAPGETRGKAINHARRRAEVILCHDSEDLGYGVEDLLSSFKFRKDFREWRPWTTVVSETREIW